MLDELQRRIAQFRSAVGERHAKLVTAVLVAATVLVAIVVGPIVFYAFTDVQRAMFLALTWAALFLLAFGVYVGCRYLLSLVPERPARSAAPMVEAAPMPTASHVLAPRLPITVSEPLPAPVPQPVRVEGKELHRLTWAELVAAGIVNAARDQYVGADMLTGQAVRAAWVGGMGSEILVGESWSGKTTRAMSRAVQTAERAGVPCLLVGDAVASSDRGLAAKLTPLDGYLIRSAEREPAGILELAHEAVAIMDARERGVPDRSPILLLMEEWADLMDPKYGIASDLTAAVAAIARKGAHYQVDVVLCSQPGTKQAIGMVHELIPTRVAFRNVPGHARYVLGREVDTTGYGQGVAAMRIRGSFYEKVQCPEVMPADLARVAALLPSPTSEPIASPASAQVIHLRPSTSPAASPTASDEGPDPLPEATSFTFEALCDLHKEAVLDSLRQGTPAWKAAQLIPGRRGQVVTGGEGHTRRRLWVQALGEAHGLLSPDGQAPGQAQGQAGTHGTEERAQAGGQVDPQAGADADE